MNFLQLLQTPDDKLSVDELCRKKYIRNRPSWDRFGIGVLDIPALAYDPKILKETGIYVPLPEDKQPKPTRWKPNVIAIFDPLFRKRGDEIPLERRLFMYKEAIDVLMTYNDRLDIFSIAMCRREITPDEGVELDKLFFACAREHRDIYMKRPLTRTHWLDLARRMPDQAPIREWCYKKACEL